MADWKNLIRKDERIEAERQDMDVSRGISSRSWWTEDDSEWAGDYFDDSSSVANYIKDFVEAINAAELGREMNRDEAKAWIASNIRRWLQ